MRVPTPLFGGDYYSVQQHRLYPDTFVGTGMTMRDGGANANAEPRYMWFGLEPDEPTPVRVHVADNVAAGSPTIEAFRTDLDGVTEGTIPFSLSYVAYQPYELRAPLEFSAGGTTYRFWKWRVRSSPSNPLIDQPEGERTLSVGSIENQDDTAVADYRTVVAYRVESRNPPNGISITVSERGLNGGQGGVTPFVRSYILGTRVDFTAPPFRDSVHPFKQWLINGTPQPLGQRTISLVETAPLTTITAEYYTNITGSVTPFGHGCSGSNGQEPFHNGGPNPQTGRVAGYTMRRVFGATPASLFIGASRTSWNGFTLPISLGLIGTDPNCKLFTGGDLVLPFATDGAGNGQIGIAIPDDPALIDQRFFTQCILIDPFVPHSLTVIVSNALATQIGGNR